jgi:hypothetical protein
MLTKFFERNLRKWRGIARSKISLLTFSGVRDMIEYSDESYFL